MFLDPVQSSVCPFRTNKGIFENYLGKIGFLEFIFRSFFNILGKNLSALSHSEHFLAMPSFTTQYSGAIWQSSLESGVVAQKSLFPHPTRNWDREFSGGAGEKGMIFALQRQIPESIAI